jgi:hypothetical protein
MAKTVSINGGVVIDGVEYVPRVPSESPVRIVILQRGWVMVGRWSQEGDDCTLIDASVIRIWGTTKGLGELIGGPTGKTVLDKAGVVRFHILTVVASLQAEESAWAPKL